MAFDEANQLAFQAKVAPGAEPVTQEFLEKYVARGAEGGQAHHRRRAQGDQEGRLRRRRHHLGALHVRVAAAAGRAARCAAGAADAVLRAVGDQHALMTFTAPAKTFDQFVPLFDKTARATVIRK